MLNNLLLHDTNFVYIRLKAIIWHSNGLLNHASLLDSATEILKNIYNNLESSKPLVVSCRGVVDTERALQNFFSELKSRNRGIIFVHTESFKDHILDSLKRIPQNADSPGYRTYSGNTISVCCDSIANVDMDKLITDIEKIENNYIKSTIGQSFKKNTGGELRRLPSTHILANGEFDASKIIGKPDKFIWVCLILADKIQTFIEQIESERVYEGELKFLAVSLRGGPFASALSLLLNKSYDTIDHLGPKHKLFDVEVLRNFKKGVRYIYVGDFIVGGTEIKIAKAYAELLGCELNYGVVLSMLLDSSIFAEDLKIISLTKIKDVVHEARYELLGA